MTFVKPPLLLRLPMRILSWVISILLVISLFVTVILTDVQVLTSSGNLSDILTRALSSAGQEAKSTQPSTQANPYAVRLSTAAPSAAPAGSSSIMDYISGFLGDTLGEEVDPAQIQQFLEESTVMDYLGEKISAITNAVVTGSDEALITTEELMDLLDENQSLIEETFDVEITDEMKAEIETEITRVVEEEDLNGTIRTAVDDVMEQPVTIPGLGEITVSQILEKFHELSQPKYLGFAAALTVILIVALLLLNYYNLSLGVRRVGRACLTSGTPFALISLLVHFGGNLAQQYMADAEGAVITIQSAFGKLAPVHYGLPLAGIALIVVGFITKGMWKEK